MSSLTSILASEEQKLLACVHCGLCLDACPTYVITGDENDSPRGRLYLMRAVADGRLTPNSKSFERHIDRCLGCRACESVCPAGVEYGDLLEASRAELHSTKSANVPEYRLLRFVLRHVWLYPRRLKLLFSLSRLFRNSRLPWLLRRLGLTKVLPQRMAFGLALLESSAGQAGNARNVERVANNAVIPVTHTGKKAMLFAGCVGEGLFSRVNEATRRVLQVQGFEIETPTEQVCCGALHAHAGDLEGARALARRNLKAFEAETSSAVVTNAGGCGAMLLSYAHLFADDPTLRERAVSFCERVRDVGELLATRSTASDADTDELTTYDASCHLLYGQHAAEASLNMLKAVGDLKFVPLVGSERCCGGAGIYNLLEPKLSQAVLGEKIENLRNTGAQTIATGNPGCQMQIGAGAKLAGLNIRVCHPVELLDEWYRRNGLH